MHRNKLLPSLHLRQPQIKHALPDFHLLVEILLLALVGKRRQAGLVSRAVMGAGVAEIRHSGGGGDVVLGY